MVLHALHLSQDNLKSIVYCCSTTDDVKGKTAYWLSGKPGSGKSTLMKYMASEFLSNMRDHKTAGIEIVVASFFFWSEGTTLQKSVVGLLRSILFQIASQRPEAIPGVMEGRTDNLREPHSALPYSPLCAWTEARLLATLEMFLCRLSSSTHLYLFIDGLDEASENEERVVEIIRLLDRSPRVNLCVSSRPEHIFRRGFAQSPQIRLQDLNRDDIEKATEDKLRPVLTDCFPREETYIDFLIWDTTRKAQGVFLWLDLTIRRLRRGALSGDTIVELRRVLESTPESIEGLYEHVLGRMEKTYQHEAHTYFALLMADVPFMYLIKTDPFAFETNPFVYGEEGGLTLLHFVVSDSAIWEKLIRQDRDYFVSSDFAQHCHSIETRILTRCAGLVEIDEHCFPAQNKDLNYGYGYLQRDNDKQKENLRKGRPFWKTGEGSLCKHLRRVNFIHKTVREFLRSHYQVLHQDSNVRSATALTLMRGNLGVINLIPLLICQPKGNEAFFISLEMIENIMITMNSLSDLGRSRTSDPPLTEIVLNMLNQTFHTIESVDAALNGPNMPWFKRYERYHNFGNVIQRLPFHDIIGFAAFFGCRIYLNHNKVMTDHSNEQLNYLLACTLAGLEMVPTRFVPRCHLRQVTALYETIQELSHYGGISNSHFEVELDSWPSKRTLVSPLAAFIVSTIPIISAMNRRLLAWKHLFDDISDFQDCMNSLTMISKAIVKNFMLHGANLNVSIFCTSKIIGIDPPMLLVLEETPLSFFDSRKAFVGHEYVQELGDVLQSHDGLRECRCHFIQFQGDLPCLGMRTSTIRRGAWYSLSQYQSDCFLKVISSSTEPNSISPWSARETQYKPTDLQHLRKGFQELIQDFTDADLVDPQSNDILASIPI